MGEFRFSTSLGEVFYLFLGEALNATFKVVCKSDGQRHIYRLYQC